MVYSRIGLSPCGANDVAQKGIFMVDTCTWIAHPHIPASVALPVRSCTAVTSSACSSAAAAVAASGARAERASSSESSCAGRRRSKPHFNSGKRLRFGTACHSPSDLVVVDQVCWSDAHGVF